MMRLLDIVVVVGILAVLAGCASAEQRRMKELAGDYRWEYRAEALAIRQTLTLRPDGTVRMSVRSEQQGFPPVEGAAQGTYMIDGVTLTTTIPDEGRLSYTIAGDTLYPRLAARDDAVSSLVGVTIGGTPLEQAFVRVR